MTHQPDEWERPLNAAEIAMIDAAWEKHKAAQPLRPAEAIQRCRNCGRERQYHSGDDCAEFVRDVEVS